MSNEKSARVVGFEYGSLRIMKTDGIVFVQHRPGEQWVRSDDPEHLAAYESVMTDEKPRDVPPWLRHPPWADEPGRLILEMEEEAIVFAMNDYPDSASKSRTLPEWLRWRSELAEALGLVEPDRDARIAVPDHVQSWCARAGMRCVTLELYECHRREFDAAEREVAATVRAGVAKAVAAELRAQAEAMERVGEEARPVYCASLLQDRANELDPKEEP